MKLPLIQFSVITLLSFAMVTCSQPAADEDTGDSVVTEEPADVNELVVDPAGADNEAPQITTQPLEAVTQGGQAGLNPAHGEPGHRCDISVGAPLDSPPGNVPDESTVIQGGNQSISTSQPVQVQPGQKSVMFQDGSQPAPQPVAQPSTAPAGGSASGRVNPAHGEPGHDCSVPVGQPLPN